MASSGNRRLDILRLRLRSLFRRKRIENELDDELQFHFDSVVEEYKRRGMSDAEARRRAHLVHRTPEHVKEECRDARGSINMIENIGRDAVYAIRGFRSDKAFTSLAVITMALAIGVNTGLFSLVYGLMYRSVPVPEPESLHSIYVRKVGEGKRSSYGSRHFVSFADLEHLRNYSKTAEIAGVSPADLSWKDSREPLRAQMVSDNYFHVIGATPLLGRFITREEAQKPGSSPVVVLSYSTWQKYFGGAKDVVGRPMILNRTVFTIVGVTDQKTSGVLVTKPEVWIPLTMQGLTRPNEVLVSDPTANWILALGRRRPGLSAADVQAEMRVLAQQSAVAHAPKLTTEVVVRPSAFLNLPEITSQGTPVIAMLFIAVSLVLLVACANVANMLLARGLNRRREIAVRLSIGSSRARLLQQLLIESALLGIASGGLGLLLASLSARTFLRAIPTRIAGTVQIDVTPDPMILIYTLGLAVVTSFVFGLLPALNALRVDLTPALKTEGLQSGRSNRMWLQSSLIAAQVAICFVLLASAALLLRGVRSAMSLDTGIATKNILIANLDLRAQQYTSEKAEHLLTILRDNASALPGVISASVAYLNPLTSESYNQVQVVQADGQPGPRVQIRFDEVDRFYFDTMKVPLHQGRVFHKGEGASDSRVAIVDAAFSTKHFGNTSALGKRLRFDSDEYEIIGVVGTTSSLSLDGRDYPKVFLPLRGLRYMESRVLMRYAGPKIEIVRGLERAVTTLDGGLTLQAAAIEDNVTEAVAPVLIAASAASGIGVLALVLACAGMYGVVSFAVSRRRREVGIRLALGAANHDVVTLLMRQGLMPVLAGGIIGLAGAVGAAQVLKAMLYGVSPIDPVAFGGTVILLGFVAALATLVPARSAVSVDPAVTLRHD